jgi:hypothetical protein
MDNLRHVPPSRRIPHQSNIPEVAARRSIRMVRRSFFILPSLTALRAAVRSALPAGKTERRGLTLQVFRPSPDVSYCIDVLYEVREKLLFDASHYEIREVSLIVTRQALGYQRQRTLFSKAYEHPWTLTTTSVEPTWRGKYIPSAEFLLPSGRVFQAKTGAILFVLFDGGQCQLFDLDPERKPTATPTNPAAYPEELDELFRSSFAPEDVYWSYALVHCARFFGRDAAPIEHAGTVIDTLALHALWRRALAAPRSTR